MISKRKSVLALAGFALAAMFSVAPAHAQTAPKVKLTTSLGDIVVQLDPAKAPKTVENFLAYVNDKHYDGTVFHRVIDGFMIQGGGFTADMQQKPTKAPIALEAKNGLKNDTYTIAMARTGNPNSATSQFFINVKDNAMLNAPSPDGHGYAVFGKVVEGTAVVDKIKAVATGNKGPYQNVPTTPIFIISASTDSLSQTNFPEGQYQSLEKNGKTEITGQAFLKTRGGDVKYAAGNKVFLEPATPFAKDYYKNQPHSPYPLTADNPRAAAYSRVTTADAQGKFAFKGIPPGDYFIVTSVTWEVAGKVQGGNLIKAVTIKNEPSLNFIISE